MNTARTRTDHEEFHPPLLRAIDHVRQFHSEVDMVVFGFDTRWHYMGSDFEAVTAFDERIDVSILEDAQNYVSDHLDFPFAFQPYWEGNGDETDDHGDDLCDKCMRSGVQVSKTDENGGTICAECDEPPSVVHPISKGTLAVNCVKCDGWRPGVSVSPDRIVCIVCGTAI